MRQIEAGKTKPIPPLLRIADSAGAVIMGPLAVLQALTPEISVVFEEDVDSHALCLSLRSYWIMDPLDGPKEFLACNGEFAVNIALIDDCEPTIGVVLAPALGAVFWCVRGQGAFRRRNACFESIHVAPVPLEAGVSWRVVASRSYMNQGTRDYLLCQGAHELLQAGSSLKFCRIAEGRADIYPRISPTCEWGTAAAKAVLEAAGGVVPQMDGTPLRYGKPDVLNPGFVPTSMLPALLL